MPADDPIPPHAPPLESEPPLRAALAFRLGATFVAMCFVPRLLRCLLADSFCPDVFFYFDRAAALEQGNLSAAFAGGMNLNLYPIVLAALHQCGLDWIDAGRVWSLFVTSVTVLPLYGWVRRLTDDRTATLGCIVYAVWPVMTEFASEPIRDPSFWMLLNLTFYLGITTAERPSIGRGLLTAVVWVMAVLTRMEGWLLLVPLTWWLIGRATQSPATRQRLVRTGVACCTGIVVFAVVANFTIGRQAGTWITGRIETALPGIPWLHALLHGSESLQPSGRVVEHIEPTTVVSFVRNFAECLDPLNLAALVLGLYCGRRLFRDPFVRPLLAYGAIMLLAIWCRIPDQRYFCQVGFVLIPFIATGAAAFIDFVGDRLSEWSRRDLRQKWTIAWLTIFAVINTVDAVDTWRPEFQNNYELAAWFHRDFPPDAVVITDRASVPARFFMSGPQPTLPHISNGRILPILMSRSPDVVVYACGENSPEVRALMSQQLDQRGYSQIDASDIGIGANTFSVWVSPRKPAEPRIAAEMQLPKRTRLD